MKSMNVKNAPLLDYFNIEDGIYISWAHAVNNEKYLDDILSDNKIMMLEADVLMDPVKNVPIMAHPPAVSSDIDLKGWLHKCSRSNKGLKLDFKQLSATLMSKELVLNFIRNDHKILSCDSSNTSTSSNKYRPFILNADVLPGPNAKSSVKSIAKEFFESCHNISDVILSPGWVTEFKIDGVGYTWDNIREMYSYVKNLMHFVTFPIRASLAGRSAEPLVWLLEQNIRFSLTVWTAKNDKYEVKELLFLRRFKQQVYFDLPKSELSELLSLSHTQELKVGGQASCVITS